MWGTLASLLYLFAPAYAADVVPVLARGHFRALDRPLDAGLTLRGRRVFGDHKTWRGVITGTAAGMIVYEIQVVLDALGVLHGLALVDYAEHTVAPGFLMSFGALAGDAVKSFFKRQLDIRPGSSWLVADQIDFFLGASLLVSMVQPLHPAAWLAALPIVFVCDVVVTACAYALGLKEAWI